MKRNLQTFILIGMLAMSSGAFAADISIKDMRGLVLVNTGEAFVTAKNGQTLHAGDQIYVLDRSAVVIGQDEGCHIKIMHNALITLNEHTLCDFQQSQVKLMGTRFAAAIGLVDDAKTSTDAPAEPSGAIGAIGGIVVEEEPIEITEADVEAAPPAAEEGTLGSLASKLAVPATVLGAVSFSALAGGGGLFGGDDGGEPDTGATNNDDQQGSGNTSEPDPISPA